ncbi:hypothetical protein [Microbacterium sp. GXF7504]
MTDITRHQPPVEVGRTRRPTTAQIMATRALSDLVDLARVQARRAAFLDRPNAVRQLEGIGTTLDRARTRLIEDGEHYIDEAHAFALAGLRALTAWGAYVDRHMEQELERARP